ncbi:MAG: bifunctional [glutamine synthetase] adenylyltransferase/[glutamine synthetase]-adenylyl-L-tyrosine phosphorylase [Alphaproteobacteria bacterium]|nr:bifunctional [glutamine synthetase] adenylyltransferase/[glutamine synthetase]-adenylyl-L-tyrosine phosphorylase [Alphaproteobacteria bacterium]
MTALRRPPLPFDPARAARTLEDLAARGFTPPDAAARALLEGAFGNSAYLARLALRDTSVLAEYFASGAETLVHEAAAAALAVDGLNDEAQAMAALRQAKRGAALAIALGDIAGAWSLEQVTGALSRFADAAVKGALRFLLAQAAARAGLAERDPQKLEETTGLVVLAMGKYGAFELNYSSDIDLVVFYDAGRFPFAKKDDPRGAAVELVRGLVKLIAERTGGDYVFRVDLRLRPDAGATQVAISTDAALDYYEAMGQNWERAAMIKARAVGGDPRAAADFKAGIAPFIWRRHLDFAAIADIHSIKRQIHAHGGHSEIAVAGHNIKLGRGGIREIEFFAQTQQLILGGRNPTLREAGTVAALNALAKENVVTQGAARDLTEAYRFLRTLEHRLQMVADEQTHTLPKDEEGLAHIACFMGFENRESFAAALTGTLQTVQTHYAQLFESEPELASSAGSLVFTGVEDDPETLATITALGFGDAAHVSGAIRGWHHGRIRAMRSARARELLTQLTPAILEALGTTADPDAAFAGFDRFLSNLVSGVQLFSLFLARPQFLKLLARIVGSAPRLATYLSRNTATLDALLDSDFLVRLPTRADLAATLARQLGTTYEEALDGARRFAREEIFRVGVQIVEGAFAKASAPRGAASRAEAAGPALAAIAETVIAGLLPRVEAELALTAGRVPGGSFCVIAMGKLGGREMTASSDLDLVFVYDLAEGVESSDGPKPLPPTLYYARLAQRLIAALTTPTAAGTLYEVDMRLRPTGNKGPAAVSLKSFTEYHASESWTWEHMALTRARVVAGEGAARAALKAAIRRRLTAQTDGAKVMADARAMRARMAESFSDKNPWDLKYAQGGLVDIEFIAQALQLVHAPAEPEVLDSNTIAALHNLHAAGALAKADAAILVAAAGLQHALTQVLRVALDEVPKMEAATPGLKAMLAEAGGAADFAALEARLFDLQARVRAIFERVLG